MAKTHGERQREAEKERKEEGEGQVERGREGFPHLKSLKECTATVSQPHVLGHNH